MLKAAEIRKQTLVNSNVASLARAPLVAKFMKREGNLFDEAMSFEPSGGCLYTGRALRAQIVVGPAAGHIR